MGVLLIVQNSNLVAAEKAKSKKMDHMKAYQMYQQKCLGCHDSVADPELPGRTRDDWHLVVNVMHGYGMDLSLEESEIIIDLLYDLRKGLEREGQEHRHQKPTRCTANRPVAAAGAHLPPPHSRASTRSPVAAIQLPTTLTAVCTQKAR